MPPSNTAKLIRSGVAVASAAAALAGGLYVARRRRMGAGFKPQRVPEDCVALYKLLNIERNERVRCTGVQTFEAVDSGSNNDISFGELMKMRNIVLYTYDLSQQILVFMEVTSKEDLWREPFLDRGVRKLASGPLYVCSMALANKYCQENADSLPNSEKDLFLFVWNTGRCGSTLLARLTSAVGCSVTLSEPDWVDQLGKDKWLLAKDPSRFENLVQLLHILDFHLARTLLPSSFTGKVIYSLNPKGNAGFLRKPVANVFPNAKHVFMYRDMLKVVESFGSIFGGTPKWILLKMFIDMKVGGPAKMAPPKPEEKFGSAIMKQSSNALVLPRKFFPKMIGQNWMDAMLHWMEFESDDEKNDNLTLRMDEFVSKDAAKKENVVKQVLRFAAIPTDPDTLKKALAVFEVNSQAGTAMEKSSAKTGKTFLTEEDHTELKILCACIPQLGKPSFIIPSSIGVKQ